ncbi:hypothetical protein DKX38_019036 [Salix brachista]|uniref:Small ribosomal subunit protein uS15 N-terminal domain-containing protein n=1 Tax=Salix brachista TaxID=2182728 RepID=A0A5N5KQC3_9ROSI|nr:hypothetical protein DKX38_019036 [Salix brachista]
MGRMHSRGKGISASALPYKRTPPNWLKISAQDVDDNICKFAKKGLTPSQIGVILRDSHADMCVENFVFLKMDKIQIVDGKCKQKGSVELNALLTERLELNPCCCGYTLMLGLAPEIPEDLYHLIKKAVAIRKHLERNRKDKDSKFRLILVESRIHRLARYYKKTKKLAPVWKYLRLLPCLLQLSRGNSGRLVLSDKRFPFSKSIGNGNWSAPKSRDNELSVSGTCDRLIKVGNGYY